MCISLLPLASCVLTLPSRVSLPAKLPNAPCGSKAGKAVLARRLPAFAEAYVCLLPVSSLFVVAETYNRIHHSYPFQFIVGTLFALSWKREERERGGGVLIIKIVSRRP